MADLLMKPEASQSPERWQDHNRRGLGFAAASDWTEAASAFSSAAEVLAQSSDMEPPHEPMALVLGNLANACFRSGRIEEALSHGQRACALRVALAGEDGMPGARARMDLAVMLATAGKGDEAMSLVRRAIRTVEHHVGEEDPNLGVILENAARIALSSGEIANAEPFLLRLHALLALHDEPTKTADRLLKRIAEIREEQSRKTLAGAAKDEVKEVVNDEVNNELKGEQKNEAQDEDESDRVDTFVFQGNWEDQPLREAVAITDVLLRNTPSGIRAIHAPNTPSTPPENKQSEEAHVEDYVHPELEETGPAELGGLRELVELVELGNPEAPEEPEETAAPEKTEEPEITEELEKSEQSEMTEVQASRQENRPVHNARSRTAVIALGLLLALGAVALWWFFFR